MNRIYLILMTLVCSWSLSFGQITPPARTRDTLKHDHQKLFIEKNDSSSIEEIETYADKFDPRRASLYAAVLPGAGQIYNRKYWKLPLVYGGFIALGYAVNFYNDLYRQQRIELFKTLDDSSYQSEFGGEAQLRRNVDKSRRERDFYIIMTGALYLLQIADAHIDAHLKEFDLNPKLKISLEPAFENSPYYGYNAGLSLKFKF